MHLTLLDPEATIRAVVVLLVLGAVTCFVARRWPRTRYLTVPLLVVTASFSVRDIFPLIIAPPSPDFRSAGIEQLFFVCIAVGVAITLTLVSGRHRRGITSRPTS